LKNFRSFKGATIEPRPLNILVGVNASGKTNAELRRMRGET